MAWPPDRFDIPLDDLGHRAVKNWVEGPIITTDFLSWAICTGNVKRIVDWMRYNPEKVDDD